MTLTTDRGKTFTARYAWGPTLATGRLMAAITDDARPLSQIAADVEGVTRFERKDEHEGDAVFEGYTRLVSIAREADGSVTLALEREAEA